MKTYVLLVAGNEYRGGGTDFAIFCRRRAQYLLATRANWRNNPDLEFILFDPKRGHVQTAQPQNGNLRWQTNNDTYQHLDRRVHYQNHRFKQQATRVLSVADVYQYIMQIGQERSGTIAELSFFGHGWIGGPLLVNSYERDEFKRGANKRLRDPWDKDGRTKDTNIHNMDNQQFAYFISAFQPNAHIWLWGCASSRMYKSVIQAVRSAAAFRAKRYGTHVDTDRFSLSFSQNFAERYFSSDPVFFQRSLSVQPISQRSFERTLREVKDFLIRGICHSYAGQLAYNSQIKVYGSILGTGSDFERSGTHRLMAVPKSSEVYGYSFNHIISFFKTYLRLSEDPENRGYIFHDPALIRSWKLG